MPARRRVWPRAAACSLAVFLAGSLLSVWEIWDVDHNLPEKPVVRESASLWGALRHLAEFGGFEEWAPNGLSNPNFWPTVILISLTVGTAVVVHWLGVRRVPPQGASDYGDASPVAR